jgi:Flp pilus assembly protein TadD
MNRKQLTVAVLALAAALPLASTADDKNASADAEIAFSNGLTHLREGRTQLALEAFKKAVKQDPKNPYFYKGLGVAHMQLADKCPQSDARCRSERLADAVSAARKALELNPYYVDARNDLGTALLRSGKRDDGKRELLAAYEDPTNPTPELSARNLGQAFMEERSYAQAETWFRTCVERNTSYAEAYVLLADAMLAQNKVAAALERLEAGEKAAPDDLGLALELGRAYYRAGRLSDARTRWDKVASKDPGGATGRRALELLRSLQQP